MMMEEHDAKWSLFMASMHERFTACVHDEYDDICLYFRIFWLSWSSGAASKTEENKA